MVLGFMIWDDHWTKKRGSAFSLNMFKCNITALWFLIVIVVLGISKELEQSTTSLLTISASGAFAASMKNICTKLNPFQNEDVKFLFVSSTVGIIIGDWMWIEGLKHLGARKIIVFDSLKPFLAAIAGWVFFNEKFNNPLIATMGLMLTVVGVALVGFEAESEKNQEEHEDGRSMDADTHNKFVDSFNTASGQDRNMAKSHYFGIFMGIMNVVLHTLGATLTKKFGVEMSTWEINFVRFGFSGLCMLLLTFVLQIRDRISLYTESLQFRPTDAASSETYHYGSVPTTAVLTQASSFHSFHSNHQETHWYDLPRLSLSSWIKVTAGVAFVSFMHPALTNYAMFQIPLALLLSLESIGPLYSLPLALVMHKECPSFRASIGTMFAVTGIALLSLQES